MAETVAFVAPDGVETVLSDQSDRTLLPNVEGRFMPPVVTVEEVVPEADGARTRSTRMGVREVAIPVAFESSTPTALRTQLRDLLREFNPIRGVGQLKVTGPGGQVRELDCRYQEGLELSEPWSAFETGQVEAVVVFRAVDPFWKDAATSSQTFTQADGQTFFPIPPITLSAEAVFSAVDVDNGGDVEAWPIWTITGPGTNPTLRNVTTGKKLELTHTLTAGDTVEIDTSPGVKTVQDGGGANLYGSLSSDSALWPLQAGSNQIRVEMSGTDGNSQVLLTWRRRWLSA